MLYWVPIPLNLSDAAHGGTQTCNTLATIRQATIFTHLARWAGVAVLALPRALLVLKFAPGLARYCLRRAIATITGRTYRADTRRIPRSRRLLILRYAITSCCADAMRLALAVVQHPTSLRLPFCFCASLPVRALAVMRRTRRSRLVLLLFARAVLLARAILV